MGNVIVHATMSLDGFLAGPNDEMDWMFNYGPDESVDEVMGAIGAVVLGHRTFELAIKNNALPYGGVVKAPQFVVTHEGRDPMTREGLTFTFVTDGIGRALELAKDAAGDKNVSILGANIAQQCLRSALADEILIHLAPLLLGKGIRLFDQGGVKPIALERVGVIATASITSLRFRVGK